MKSMEELVEADHTCGNFYPFCINQPHSKVKQAFTSKLINPPPNTIFYT